MKYKLFNTIFIPCKPLPYRASGFERDEQIVSFRRETMALICAGKKAEGRKNLEGAYFLGDKWAGNTLAIGLCDGWFGDNDYEEALTIFRDLAERGHAEAMNNLGTCYEEGKGVEKDLNTAYYWYKRAAELGSYYAMGNYALLVLNGKHIKRELGKAIRLLNRAKDKNEYAMNTLGLCYLHGIGVEQSFEKAKELFMTSSERGCPDALVNLEKTLIIMKTFSKRQSARIRFNHIEIE